MLDSPAYQAARPLVNRIKDPFCFCATFICGPDLYTTKRCYTHCRTARTDNLGGGQVLQQSMKNS